MYPLVGAVGAALAFAAIIITHDLRTNHEVLVRKETRRMRVCTPEEDPAAYDRLVGLARKSYDHGLRRSLLGYKPWVFSRFQEWASGVSREDRTVDLSREKWTLEQSRRGLLSERPPLRLLARETRGVSRVEMDARIRPFLLGSDSNQQTNPR